MDEHMSNPDRRSDSLNDRNSKLLHQEIRLDVHGALRDPHGKNHVGTHFHQFARALDKCAHDAVTIGDDIGQLEAACAPPNYFRHHVESLDHAIAKRQYEVVVHQDPETAS